MRVINSVWKFLNYFIILCILAAAGYFIIFRHPGQGNLEPEDQLKMDVRRNAQYPKLVAWLFPNRGQGSQPAVPSDPLLAAFPDAQQPGGNYNPNLQGELQNTPLDTQGGAQAPGNEIVPFPDPALPGNTEATPAQAPTAANVTEKILQEGHWIGLEVGPLTPALATANGIPANIKGVLVDEVTLLSAGSGLLAGDVITAINNIGTFDLYAFKAATRPVAMSKHAIVTVYRAGAYKKIAVNGVEELGLAQMEAAPMINATDPSPHAYYGPCDKCHAISKTVKNTGQLAKDGGDILITQAPAIKWGAKATHRDRGKCTNCHRTI